MSAIPSFKRKLRRDEATNDEKSGVTQPRPTGLISFVPKSDASKILIGEPESDTVDVGEAL
jgi:hypothetical protein